MCSFINATALAAHIISDVRLSCRLVKCIGSRVGQMIVSTVINVVDLQLSCQSYEGRQLLSCLHFKPFLFKLCRLQSMYWLELSWLVGTNKYIH